MNIAKKMQQDASTALDQLTDWCLDIDVKQIGIDIHYTDADIMNATYVFQHIISNRMIHNMIKDNKQKQGKSKAFEMGDRLRDYIIDATGFDPHTFYSNKKKEG